MEMVGILCMGRSVVFLNFGFKWVGLYLGLWGSGYFGYIKVRFTAIFIVSVFLQLLLRLQLVRTCSYASLLVYGHNAGWVLVL